MTCRLLLSLLSSVMPSLAIGFWLAIALPSLSSAVTIVQLACLRYDALGWRATRCSRCGRRHAVSLIGGQCCSHACAAALYGVPLAALTAVVGYAVVGCRDGIINYYQLSSLFNSLVCVPPLCVVRRSLLSLLSLALPSSVVASTSPWLSSADVVARLARVRAAAPRGVLLAALAAVVGMPSLSHRMSLLLKSLACVPPHCMVPLAALAAVVGYAVVGCCVGLAIALIRCLRCSPRSRA